MTTHRFVATEWHNVLGTLPPALTVASGDTVVTETIDAGGWDKDGVQRAHGPNPMNGPIAVDGAEPGDALRVDIVAMTPIRDTGWTRASLAANVVDPEAVRELPSPERVTWRIERNALTASLDKPPPALTGLKLPLEPMIGCFGVAPSRGQAFLTATSAENGGNMDYRRFCPGTTVSFPISVPGALFFLGDCHATQGDGEIVGTGIETCYEVTVRLTVEKGRKITWPRGETAEDIFTVGNARPLDQALQHATTEMMRWLGEDFGLDSTAASHLMGQVVRYDVGNVYDPAYTMACRMPKQWLPERREVSAPIRLGLIGCGFFAQNHLHAWTDLKPEGIELVAVCDIDPAKAKAAADKFGVPNWYTDATEMLQKENLGLVDIATQVRSHLPLVTMTIGKGIPTIVQKPFGQNLSEVRQMVESARKSGVFLAVHENFRYQRPLLRIAEIARSGEIGTPSWARVSFRTGYDIYTGQPYLRTEDRFVLIDLGVHVLDVARVLLGEVAHLSAERQHRNPDVAGEDTATMLCRHASGAVSVVECTYGSRRLPDSFPETLIELEGDRGAIVSRIGSRIEVTSGGQLRIEDADPVVLPWAERPWHVAQDSVVATCRELLRALKEGRPAPTSAEDNFRTFALVEAAYRDGTVTPEG